MRWLLLALLAAVAAGYGVRSGHAHRWLRCRLLQPDGSSARSQLWCDSYTLEPGLYKRGGIHAGPYDLHISATWDGPRIVRRIELRPGETLRLTVRLP